MEKKLSEKISEAHQLSGVNYALADYENIFELLKEKAKEYPDRMFLKYYSDSGESAGFSYAGFFQRVKYLTVFLTSYGLGFKDRIATYLHNYSDAVSLYFAAWSLGITVVPLNVNEDLNRIKFILENADVRMIFTLKQYKDIIKTVSEFSPVISFEELDLENSVSDEDHTETYFDGDTEALIVYTSGTTGNPKGVVLTHRNLLTDAKFISNWHNLNPGDVMLCILPIHHVNGTVVTLVTPMYYGGTVVLTQKFHSHRFFEIIEKENVKVVSVVPTILQYLLHSDEIIANYSLAAFSHIICGAGPLTSELARKFEDKFNLRIVHGYGLSETTCYSCFIPVALSAEEHKKWQNEFGFPSIGIPLKCNEMDIQDENGNSIKEGERGEIVIRGQNVMKYYFENDEANMSAFKNGWFRSGDEGFFKTDVQRNKYFFITGRIKELIIRGGVNISPFEIDEILAAVKYVHSGMAVGFENDWYGEEVGALVILKNEFTKDDPEALKTLILQECRNQLPGYKCPKVVVFTGEIPVTSTGKYQRNKAKHLFSKYKNVQFKL